MLDRVIAFGMYAMFWLTVFVLSTMLFLTYNYQFASALSFVDILLIFWHGMKMNFSAVGYFLLIPTLLLSLTSFFSGKFLSRVLNIYTGLLLFVVTLIVVGDLELYRNWGFRMDATPLLYLAHPKEAMASTPFLLFALLVLTWMLFLVGGVYVYFKMVSKYFKDIPKGNWKIALTFLLLTVSLLLPIRGSFGHSNMNVGFVYFHKTNVFANHAAINVLWNVGDALTSLDASFPDDFYDTEKTKKSFALLSEDNGKTVQILDALRPNVIILIIESFTSKIIAPLGGREGVTPNFNKLVGEGILFSNIYASGYRTDHGIVSVLSGYPALPSQSIIKYPKKSQSLPYISKVFKKAGYHTEFIMGGDIDYANFRSYLTNAAFDKIVSEEDFLDVEFVTDWGVHDHEVLEKIIEEIEVIEKPFFLSTITLSSHEPFNVPMETVIRGKDEESRFLNAAYYADMSIGAFIETAKTKDWWENTLVVMVADHGSRHPNNDPSHVPEKFEIPMLMIGGALKIKDIVFNKYGNQRDIVATVLNQIGLSSKSFEFSKNLLSDSSKSFATYSFNNGYGFLTDGTKIVYDLSANKYIIDSATGGDKETAKAYLQKIFWDYNER